MAEIARAMACLVCLTFIPLCLKLPPFIYIAYPAYPVFIPGLHARVESEDQRRDEVEFKGVWYIFHKFISSGSKQQFLPGLWFNIWDAYPAYPVFLLGFHARVENDDQRRDEVEFKGVWYIFHKFISSGRNQQFLSSLWSNMQPQDNACLSGSTSGPVRSPGT